MTAKECLEVELRSQHLIKNRIEKMLLMQFDESTIEKMKETINKVDTCLLYTSEWGT